MEPPVHLEEQVVLDCLTGRLDDEARRVMLAHVDRCDGCRELGAAARRGTGGPAGAVPAATGPASARPGAGAVLADRYELLEALGAGAMGTVWRARDRSLGSDVALKLLPEERSRDEEFLARFRDELLLARRISHPNVCRLHDLGRAADRWYLTMEVVEGTPLSAVAVGGAMEPGRVQSLLEQIAAGLTAAHRAGVVHRDLKPSNVIVTPDERAVILDFGIARREGDGGRTEAGVVVGTPRYMAPEQAETSRVDARADVYALGLIGCELLTGAVPLDRGEVIPTLVARRQEEPPSVASLAPGVPAPLARVLDACLRRDPDLRPADGAAVLALLEGRAEVEPLPRRGLRAWLLLAGIAALGLLLWRPLGAPPEPLVLGGFEAARPDESWLAAALPGLVSEELRDGWGLVADHAEVDGALTGTVRRAGGGQGLVAEVRRGRREVELRASDPRSLGLAVARWLVEGRPRSAVGPSRAELERVGCDSPEAWRHYRRGRRAAALEQYDRAVALAEASVEEGPECAQASLLLRALSDDERWEQAFAGLTELAVDDPVLQVEAASRLVRSGAVERGVARLEALGREGPDRSLALRRLAALESGYVDGWLSRAPAPERGLRHAEQAVEAAPQDTGALALRGLARALAGDHAGAESDAATALAWASEPPESAILALLTSAATQARWDDAAAAGRRLLEAGDGQRAEALTLLAGVDLARGAFERGQGRIAEAAERYAERDEPELASQTWLFLSWTHELLDEEDGARAALDRARAADPAAAGPGSEIELASRVVAGEGPLLAWHRARVAEAGPGASEATEALHLELYAAWRDRDWGQVRQIHRAITLSGYVETWAAFPAAEAAQQAGDLETAAALFRALVEDPWSWDEGILVARARLELGRALVGLGRPDEARAALEAFVASWDEAPPDAPELRQARQLLAGLQD